MKISESIYKPLQVNMSIFKTGVDLTLIIWEFKRSIMLSNDILIKYTNILQTFIYIQITLINLLVDLLWLGYISPNFLPCCIKFNKYFSKYVIAVSMSNHRGRNYFQLISLTSENSRSKRCGNIESSNS